jgi:hypothetical protein
MYVLFTKSYLFSKYKYIVAGDTFAFFAILLIGVAWKPLLLTNSIVAFIRVLRLSMLFCSVPICFDSNANIQKE